MSPANASERASVHARAGAPVKQAARQNKTFQEVWKIVNENYVYPNFNGVDWKAKKSEMEAAIGAGMGDGEFYFRMRRLIESLNDQHSVFLPPFVAEEIFELYLNSGEYEGVGLVTGINRERRYLYVLQVFPGSSAEKAGIRPHDHILTIGGYPAVDRDGYSQSFLLNGPSGSSVAITVQAAGGAPRGLDLPRETLPAVDLVDQRLLPNAAGKKIGYLLIPTFFSTTIDAQIRSSLKRLMASAGGKLDGLVVDMRINSGGSITSLTSTLSLFTKGPVGKFSARKKALGAMTAKGESIGNSQTVPIVTLTGPDTASAAEIFAGALQFKQRSRIAGLPSQGNIEGLRTYVFDDGSILFIAEQLFRLPNGFNWEGVGLQPEVTAPGAWDDITVDNDPAILAATSMLAGQ